MHYFTTVNPAGFTVTTHPPGGTTRNVIESDPFMIACNVSGGTPSTLDWYRNGMRLTENNRIGLTHPGPNEVVFTIRHLNETDSGAYTCVARITDTMSINTTINLNVLSKFWVFFF